jgi:hypothetical protein
LLKDLPHMQNDHRRILNVYESTIVSDVAKNVPQIYIIVENRQEENQALAVELEGIISK